MKNADWKGTAELIGIAAVVASLLFVGYQLKQDADIARGEAVGNFISTVIELNQGTYPYAEIVMRANRGEELSEAEAYILESMVANFAANIQFQNIRIRSIGGNFVNTPELFLAAQLYQNPGLRAAWEQSDLKAKAFVDPLRSPESLARTYQSGSGAFRDRINAHLATLDGMYRDTATDLTPQ